MSTPRDTADQVDGYIANFPADVQERLEQIRRVIRSVAPDAQETISYAIPAYKTHGKPLIYFAGYAKHIGVYPLPEAPGPELAKEIAPFTTGKGTLQFPHREPLPLDLIRRVVESRLRQLSGRDQEGRTTSDA
ncbi:MAG: iron chaperone [Thermomicrobiales bacterium]